MRSPLFSLALLLVAAAPSHAAGLGLRWHSCAGGGGVANASFACDTNTGSDTLFASYQIPYDLSYMPTGYEAVIDVATAGETLSPWWSATCRGASMTFTERLPFPCFSTGEGAGVQTVTSFISPRGPNAMRFVFRSAIFNPPRMYAMYHEAEYGIVMLVLDHAKTVGPDACGGCSTPACIVLNSITIFGYSNFTYPILRLTTAGFGPESNSVTWQSGAGVQVGPAIGCPAATSTRRSAWGEVKALYR